MEPDDQSVEMNQLLEDENADEYAQLHHQLQNRNFETFRYLVHQALIRQPASIDINHLLPYPIHKSLLDIAASENRVEFVEFLLSVGADPNILNPEYNRAPIHFAAESGNVAALGVLLRDSNIRVNLEAGGLTALHYAVKAGCLDCARLLLQAGASPNIPNQRGITAPHLAAEKNNAAMVQLIIDNSTDLDLDTYRDRRENTARLMIAQKFPDLDLPAQTMKIKTDYGELLRYTLRTNDEARFISTLEKVKDTVGLDNKDELLRVAIEQSLPDATEALLKRGALDPVHLYDLAKVAIMRANPEILKLLLRKNSGLADRLLMTASQELTVPAKPGPGNRNNRLECFKIILGHGNVNVRQEDDKGNTPLHYAARAESEEAMKLLLRRGCYIGHMNDLGVPPLAHVTSDILESHLDDCLSSTNERTEEYEIVMDYENLVPHDTSCGADDDFFLRRRSSRLRTGNPCSETEAVLYIAEHPNLRHLLKHPLLASFLYIKFLRIRHVLYANFLLFLIYFAVLISYIWVITLQSTAEHEDMTKSTAKDSEHDKVDNENGSLSNWDTHLVHSIILLMSMLYMVVRELLQFLSTPLHYLTSPENWLELTLIGLTCGLLAGAGREIGTAAILFSFWELIILIGQHPRMSTDIEMFKRVTVSFTRCLFLYMFLIIAFALAFFVLFKNEDTFFHPISSLFKTIVMLTGELDSGELPFSTFPIMSRLVFIGFIFLIVIILVNLLNGLAVNDTGEILSEAELYGLISRARLVAYAERIAVGSPFVPKSRFCCCINYLPFQSLTTAPVRFISRRLLLFPRYLPQAKLSVKPLKSYSIQLIGRPKSQRRSKRFSTLKMEPRIVERAKEILESRHKRPNDEKIIEQVAELLQKREQGVTQLSSMNKRLDGMEELLKKVEIIEESSQKRFDRLNELLLEIKAAIVVNRGNEEVPEYDDVDYDENAFI